MNSNDNQPRGSVHPACLDIDVLLESCDVRRTRASGPGGQRRNKVETAVEIVHRPTGEVALAYERRSQEQNRRAAIRRLREQLAIGHRTVESDYVQPSALWESRCRSGKIHCNDNHTDFAPMLAEAMNAIHAKLYDTRKAAAALGCTNSQLVRFIAKRPEALQRVNEQRILLGLKRLRS